MSEVIKTFLKKSAFRLEPTQKEWLYSLFPFKTTKIFSSAKHTSLGFLAALNNRSSASLIIFKGKNSDEDTMIFVIHIS